ncbi:MAG: hypothetical protein PVI88_00460 [Nitrosopumilaceae archaeon]|jgi:hypothetical protein
MRTIIINKGKWYNYKELVQIAKHVSKKYSVKIYGTQLKDNGTYKKCNGAYGCNLLEKVYAAINYNY